jgi:hypothetical protein
MSNKSIPAAPNSTGLSIDPSTGKPFANIPAWAAYEHGKRVMATHALVVHLNRRTAHRR